MYYKQPELKKKLRETTLYFSLYLAIIHIVITLIQYFTIIKYSEARYNTILSFSSYVLVFALYFFAIKQYHAIMSGAYISKKKAIVFLLKISIYGSLIASIYSLFQSYILDPNYIQMSKDMMMNDAINSGASQQDLDLVTKMMNVMFNPLVFFLIAFMGYLFIGFITSLIAGAIFSKSKPINIENI